VTDPSSRLDGLELEVRQLRKEVTQLRALVVDLLAAGDLQLPAPLAEPVVEAAPAVVVEPASAAEQPTITFTPPEQVAAPGPPPEATEWTPPPPAAPPRPPRRSARQLAEDWELTGPRGFAVVGGAVLALGIGFFFVLAANRGWIGEEARVALGAAASALALGVGLVLRARYGQYWAALGAVGAGIAGAYATLAAATARYDLVPDALGLPIAGVIAAVATAIAIRWHSQAIAGLGLLGSALAPALQGLDTGLTWASVAFALIVLAAAAVVAIPRAWLELLHVTTALVGIQVLWLVRDEGFDPGAGTVAVTAVLAALLLAIAVALQLAGEHEDLDPLALTYSLLALGVPLATTSWLFDGRGERGVALLSMSLVWAAAFALLARLRRPDLALVVGSSALALTALGTALLLTDSALVVAWSVEAVLLAGLARRFADARLQLTAMAYAALAVVAVIAGELVPPLFDPAGDHLGAVLPLGAVAVALLACGAAVRSEYAPRTETGLLAVVSYLRGGLELHRRGWREALVVAGLAFATLSVASALVAASFRWGHVLAIALAALVGAALLAAAGRLRSDGLGAAGFGWLGVVGCTAFAFDVARWYDDETTTSIGGWSVLALAAALLGGAYANRVQWPGSRNRDLVFGGAAIGAGVVAALGVGLVSTSSTRAGIGMLACAVVFTAVAAHAFGNPDRRNISTVLWSTGLVFLVVAEATLVHDASLRGATIAATALGVAALATPLREQRLWLAGGALSTATAVVVLLALAVPQIDDGTNDRWAAIATGACAVAAFSIAALRWGEAKWRDLVTVLWATGLVALLATERILIGNERATVVACALTGGALALLAAPLREDRVWTGGAVVVACALAATLALWATPAHLLVASSSPAEGLLVLGACLLALVALAWTATDPVLRGVLETGAGAVALYGVSLGILGLAEVVSTASVETDFERGHTMVSGIWAFVGLGLLVLGLLRGSTALRYGGLALFGLSVAKIFLYDLSSLSSVARAFSFILVGGLILAGGFFLQRLGDRLGPPRPS